MYAAVKSEGENVFQPVAVGVRRLRLKGPKARKKIARASVVKRTPPWVNEQNECKPEGAKEMLETKSRK